ncbi:MAG: VOC family protein [Oscillospiraceae bacterium]|nr:VOC family protein [Oscillospiraceae bacterium]
MKACPYLTFAGQCAQAIELYKKAFKTDTLVLMKFSDIPPSPDFPLPKEAKELILQATLKIGESIVRMSDCFGHPLNEQETERVAIAVESDVPTVKHAFATLAEEGRVGVPLSEQFYSPCTGVVFDKFGVMWNLIADPQQPAK